MRKVKGLMWRHLVARRRRLVRSCVEAFVGAALFLALFSARKELSGGGEDGQRSQHETEPLSQDELARQADVQAVFYAPNGTAFARRLMERVEFKLKLHPDNIVGYESEEMLLFDKEKLLKLNKRYLAVIFNDMDGESPKRLNYTIRSSPNYEILKSAPSTIVPGPHEQYGHVYEQFAVLQIAVDTAFIEVTSKLNLVRTVSVQPFPYPPYTKDDFWSIKFDAILPFVTINGYLFLIIIIIGRLLVEKASGMKELLKMMGVGKGSLWVSHYLDCLLFQVIAIVLITTFLKTGDHALVPKTNTFLLGSFVFIYINYVILFSFATSTFFSESLLASLVVITCWIVTQVIQSIYLESIKHVAAACFWSLLPNGPVYWIYKILGFYEQHGEGLQFETLFSKPNQDIPLSFGGVLILLAANCFILILTIFYVENVNPGPYGVPKPLTYFCHKSYWFPKSITPNTGSSVGLKDESENIENPPPNAECGVKIIDVWKVYSTGSYKKTALAGVSLDIYKGGITALLGHNGAGKTTLMSIITGMIPATSGQVYVNGLNTKNRMNEIHKNIGLCPQENIAFPDLTVEEHILFLGMIQGLSRVKAKEQCETILSKLNLANKANELCNNLSGGARRRLQLALALSGNSSVLILDEPTSGLDPKHRREIWDILMNLKRDHTILLTTHFMEEADILGDRIAILDSGRVKCYGTSIYLKNKICPGYKLTIIKSDDCDTGVITKEIKKTFDDCMLHSDSAEILQYVLKSNDSKKLGALVAYLESKKDQFGIGSLGLALPLMEEVFLRVCTANENYERIEINGRKDETDAACLGDSNSAPCHIVVTILLWKKYLHAKKSSLVWILMFILLAALTLFATILSEAPDDTEVNNPIRLNLAMYNKNPIRVFYSTNKEDHVDLTGIFDYDGVEFERANDTYMAVLSAGTDDITSYADGVLVALALDKYEYTGLYSTSVYHALPVVVNLITNVLAAEALGNDQYAPHISVYNRPLAEDDSQFRLSDLRPAHLIILWGCLLCIGWSLCMSVFLSYPIAENLSGARELILMTGISKLTYYATMYIYDLIACFVFSILMLLILVDPYETFTWRALGAFMAILAMYFPVMLTAIYVLSFVFNNNSSGFVYFFIFNIVSCIYSLISFSLRDIKSNNGLFDLLAWIIKLFPSSQLDIGIFNIAQVAHERMACIKLYEKMNQKLGRNRTDEADLCCERDEVTHECMGLKDYFKDASYGIEKNIISLGALFVAFLILLVIFESKIVQKLYNNILLIFDEDIKASNRDIQSYENNGQDTVDAPIKSVEVNDVSLKYVTKYYPIKRTNTMAVRSLSFSIKKGDCFGLIGLNGAGKTTTFKILTGNKIPTLGKVSVFGWKLDENKKKYFSAISYCPQFDALGDYLTGRQALTIFCHLRGVPKARVKSEVARLLELTGVQKLADVPIACYSGGNKRKLSLAVSLAGLRAKGSEGLILLDEPTSGVDPQSRVVLHNAIVQGKLSGNSVILSSHNLSECESLCNQIGILVDGKMEYTDNAQKVKHRYGFGYSLTIKMKSGKDTQDGPPQMRDPQSAPLLGMKAANLKEHLSKNTNWTLRDHHGALLQYHIGDDHSYSSAFSKMEQIKECFDGDLETYTICETTLEEAFLAFVSNPRTTESSSL